MPVSEAAPETPADPADPTALLFYAVLRGDTEGAEAALNAGVSANEEKETHWEIAQNYADENNAKMFAFVFSPEASGIFQKNRIAPPRPPLYFAVKKNHYETALLLLDRGAKPNWTAPPKHSEFGDSFALLPLAVRNGDTRLVSALLRAGADVNHVTEKGMTALRVAVRAGQTEMVRLLLAAGANAAYVSRRGDTLLMESAGYGGITDWDSTMGSPYGKPVTSDEMAKIFKEEPIVPPENFLEIAALLLAHGADLNAATFAPVRKNKSLPAALSDTVTGKTALCAAVEAKSLSMARFLLDAGADPNQGNPLLAAACAKSDLLTLLYQRGANVNQANRHGETPLICAACSKNADAVSLLLQWGADPHARCTSNENQGGENGEEAGRNALMEAVLRGHEPCALLLLDAGTDINAHDAQGRDALMLAAASRHTSMVRLLLERGANPNHHDNDGKNARDWAHAPTKAVAMIEKLTEKWGEATAKINKTMTRKFSKDVETEGLPAEQAADVEKLLTNSVARMTNRVQEQQAAGREKLRREAENQAEILRLLPPE